MEEFLYDLEVQELTAYLREVQGRNIKVVAIGFSDALARIESLFNLQHKIASPLFRALVVQKFLYSELSELQRLLFSAYHKNIVSLFAAFELTKTGLHGPAKASLRYAYEALMIAKFCALTSNKKLLERWIQGKHISLGRDILRKVQEPDTTPFWTFWGILSDYTHATVHAQQVSLQAQHELKEINLNLVLLQILLECNYHLLNSHFATTKLNYYIEVYGYGDKSSMSLLKKQAKLIFREARSEMAQGSVSLITAYKRKWVVEL